MMMIYNFQTFECCSLPPVPAPINYSYDTSPDLDLSLFY